MPKVQLSQKTFFLCTILLVFLCNLTLFAGIYYHFVNYRVFDEVQWTVVNHIRANERLVKEGRYREIAESLLDLKLDYQLKVAEVSLFSEVKDELITSNSVNSEKICNDSFLKNSTPFGFVRDDTFCLTTPSGVLFQVLIDRKSYSPPLVFRDFYLGVGALYSLFVSLALMLMVVFFVRSFSSRILEFTAKAVETDRLPDRFPDDFLSLQGTITKFYARILTLQSEVERREKLSVLGEISKQVAHDIRSPLTALSAVCYSASGLTASEKNLIQIASSRINSIADDILTFGGNERVKSVSLKEVVEELEKIIQLKQRTLPSGQILLDLDRKLHIETFVTCDQKILARIFENLLNNAVEASKYPDITVTITVSGDKLFFSFADRGIGITTENLRKIFTEGVSIGKSTGNGLGLYHARKNIESWGGKIRADSAAGTGTCITLEILLSNQKK